MAYWHLQKQIMLCLPTTCSTKCRPLSPTDGGRSLATAPHAIGAAHHDARAARTHPFSFYTPRRRSVQCSWSLGNRNGSKLVVPLRGYERSMDRMAFLARRTQLHHALAC
ncbi:uncharacterized protein LOC133913851 [Phragmites australis]|uniref:uncharacterized protein LOC133913851 n=1 Tax=Phragmites australis TaxID=29695 RepID=UPI002D791FEF|nr:uncharacterized protein LOC133913851 [Phragmites australis]